MAVYVVTGKLGSGKTLATIGKIRDYLEGGRKVATNLDVDISKLIGKKKKNTRFYRVPDHPQLRDIQMLGKAYDGPYDESKTGAIVLDECGTWLNSRDWQDKSRRPLLDYLLHIRKLGWDVFFIVQDISILDKQFRKALCEHVVYCRRTDRMSVPLFGFVYKLFTGRKLPVPKMHLGIVKYGDLPTSLTVDRWWYHGASLYPAYDTSQIFQADTSAATYSVLPPFYIHRNRLAVRNLRFYMRLTKIYARKYSRLASFMVGAICITALNYFLYSGSSAPSPSAQEGDSLVIGSDDPPAEEELSEFVMSDDLYDVSDWFDVGALTLKHLQTVRITGYFGGVSYTFESDDGQVYSSRDIRDMGFSVVSRGRCKAVLNDGERYLTTYCKHFTDPLVDPALEVEEEFLPNPDLDII